MMEDMIRKSAVVNRLKLLKVQTEMNAKVPKTKRAAMISCIEDMEKMVDEIEVLEKLEEETRQPVADGEALEQDPEHDQEPQEESEIPKIPMDKILEPIMKGSAIGIERHRCGQCKAVVHKEDHFCRNCGAAFGEIVNHKTNLWDTVRNCAVVREVS